MARLNSLVDLIKINLYFTEGLSENELAGFIRQKMLTDYSFEEVRKFISSCLSSTKCFYSHDGHIWHVDKRGIPENDGFYNKLFKEQAPMRFGSGKNSSRNKKKKVINLALNLVPDGRFVQLDGGRWGLTEWEVDPKSYRLRHLVIKVLANNPEGLKLEEITEKVGIWREYPLHTVRDLLNKYPYFLNEKGIWLYDTRIRTIYDRMTERHIASLRRHKLRFFKEKAKMAREIENKDVVLQEIKMAKEQVAAVLAEKSAMMEDYEHVVQRFAEKDLLLSLRKKELIKCKKEKTKLENKAACILRECRKWVEKTRNLEQENDWLVEEAKVYKNRKEESERKAKEIKDKLMQLKEKYASEKAELIRENINLKHRLDKYLTRLTKEEKELKKEISRLSSDLKKALYEGEERKYALEKAENELRELRKELRRLKGNLNNPLVRLSMKLAGIFAR